MNKRFGTNGNPGEISGLYLYCTFARAGVVEKLLRKYRDVPMALADACLVALADQMDTGQILTLDRDFEIYRWRSRRKFDLLVELS